MNTVAILAVIYHEPEWIETCECLSRCRGIQTFFADRRGVDGLASAFNDYYELHKLYRFDCVWFVSNIRFGSEVPWRLVQAMDSNPDVVAIQPAYKSDHKHLRSDGSDGVRSVPFVEFTCPMVRTSVFNEHKLDPEMPYTGHDIDWSYRVRQNGGLLGVHNGVEVEHSYLRHLPSTSHPATEHRKRLRAAEAERTEKHLISKYGVNWRDKLNYHGSI